MRSSKPNDLPWLLIDANGRVCKEVHRACGSFGAEEPNDNGKALLMLADAFDLYLPATFEGHSGPASTWRSPAGFEARIDYVACPRSMAHAVSGSSTGTIDLCAPRLDHRFSALRLAFTLTQSQTRSGQRRFMVPSDAADQLSQAIASTVPCAWVKVLMRMRAIL